MSKQTREEFLIYQRKYASLRKTRKLNFVDINKDRTLVSNRDLAKEITVLILKYMKNKKEAESADTYEIVY